MNKLYENIDRLVDYGLKKGLITDDEAVYSRNLLLDIFKENEYEETGASFDDGNDNSHCLVASGSGVLCHSYR